MAKKVPKQDPVCRKVRWEIPSRVGYSPRYSLVIELDLSQPKSVTVYVDRHDNGEETHIQVDLRQFADATMEVQERHWENPVTREG